MVRTTELRLAAIADAITHSGSSLRQQAAGRHASQVVALVLAATGLAIGSLSLPGCDATHAHESHHHEEHHKILVTSPLVKDIVSTQQYVSQIHSRRHIEVRALEGGYLEEIQVKEGQAVQRGDLLFKLLPTLYEAKLDSEAAEAQQAQIEYNNTKKLCEQNIVSKQELKLAEAKLAKAKANVKLAEAELNFTEVKAPFDGIIDRLRCQHGSLISEGDILTTLSDNSVMWVYFNVPEARYLEYKSTATQRKVQKDDDDDDDDDKDDDKDDDQDEDEDDDDDDRDDHDEDEVDNREEQHSVDAHTTVGRGAPHEMKVELVLADGSTFDQPGKIGAIEADFNNETGNIAFRADFDNPKGLLRHGQTGTILISRSVPGAIVIPQRATFEILAKRYAYVVGEDGVVHQRDIVIDDTLDDIYVIKSGLQPTDKIVLEGIGQVRDGEKVEYEYLPPEKVIGNLKYKAE